MADFGLYRALSGRKNWGQVRQDRLMETQMLSQMKADLEDRVAKEAEARAGVADYMQQLNQTSVLEQDYERVKAREEEERKAIVKGIQEAGGSYQKFLLGNGASIMANYRNNLMNSEEMRKAINNKLVFAQASLDDYLGRVQRPVYDEQGNRVPWKTQMEQFRNGETDVLRYEGSVQPVDMIKVREAIQNTYGKNRYKKQAASQEDVRRIMMELGAEDWMAEDAAAGYGYGVQAGAEPIYWKQDEMPRASNSASSMQALMNALVHPDLYSAYLRGASASGAHVGTINDGNGKRNVVYSYSSVNEPLLNELFKSSYINPTSDGRFVFKGNVLVQSTGKVVNMQNDPLILDKENIIDYVNVFAVGENGEKAIDAEGNPIEEGRYIRAQVDLPESAERQGGVDERDDRWQVRRNKTTEVLIPVDDNPVNVGISTFPQRDEQRYQERMWELILNTANQTEQ